MTLMVCHLHTQWSKHGAACARLLWPWAAARVNIDLLVSKLRTGSWFLIKNELQQQQQPMLALVFLTVILVRT